MQLFITSKRFEPSSECNEKLFRQSMKRDSTKQKTIFNNVIQKSWKTLK